MYRFLTLVALLLMSIPVGLSVSGCGYNVTNYCQNAGFGKHTKDVESIDLEPKLTGISLSFGQTTLAAGATGFNCNHDQVNIPNLTYGSDNRSIADLSPTGTICAGTWNKTSGGGIADYTICTPPAASGTANLTAQGGGATSNTVTVFVHPPIASATLDNAGGSCLSQNDTIQLDETAYISGSSAPFCSTYGNASNKFNNCAKNPANGVPDCICNVGHFDYSKTSGGVVTIDENNIATSREPGTTLVTASISAVTLDSGYLTSCAPAKIALSVPPSDVDANGVVKVTATTAVPITATVTDIKGKPITNLPLTYTSTNPLQLSVNTLGSVSTTFPGTAQVSAVCAPPLCNPSPLDKIGQFSGTGQPVTSSNTLTFQSPGNSSNFLWLASPDSPYFTHFDLSVTSVSAPIKMPYTPNSMVIDYSATTLYFGSFRELMIYNAVGNSLTKEDASVPGVVLAASPLGNTIVINDQIRQLIYLYSPSAGVVSTTGGLATRAAYSADGNTVYVTGPNALYVHNTATGWSTYTLPTAQIAPAACSLDNASLDPFCAPDLDVTKPSVGAFISGTSTTARSYCYSGLANPPYFPPTTDAAPATDRLSATADGKHVIGASANPARITDISTALPVGPCPTDLNTALTFSTGFSQTPLPVAPLAIDQVVSSFDSSLAFVTYSGTTAAGAVLPAYQVSATPATAGTLTSVALTGAATAPLAGVFSPNNLRFFVSTSGDNLVHVVDTKTLKDILTITPGLTDPSGKTVPVLFLAVKPRSTT